MIDLDKGGGTMEADVRHRHTAPIRRNSIMRTRDDHRWQTNGNTSQERVEMNDEVIGESGVTVPIWRLYQLFWLLICLYFPLAAMVSKPDTWLRFAVGSLALLFFAVSYTWIMWPHPASQEARTPGRSRLSLLLLIALCLQVTVFSLSGWSCLALVLYWGERYSWSGTPHAPCRSGRRVLDCAPAPHHPHHS